MFLKHFDNLLDGPEEKKYHSYYKNKTEDSK